MEQTNIIPIIEYLKTNPREIEYNNEKLREALKDVIFCDDAFATDLQKDYENNENAFKNINALNGIGDSVQRIPAASIFPDRSFFRTAGNGKCPRASAFEKHLGQTNRRHF